MIGVHEDEVGSTYYYVTYRRGDIVNHLSDWGVVVNLQPSRYQMWPTITWLSDGEWQHPVSTPRDGLSAPYSHNWAGIPDEVLAKATFYKLVDTDAEPDTNDSNRRT